MKTCSPSAKAPRSWCRVRAASAGRCEQTKSTTQRTHTYDKIWSSLNTLGFSPTTQAIAASKLVEASPSDAYSPTLQGFASVDLDQLKQADANIRAGVDGQATLEKYPIPPTVAGAIAAQELKNKGADAQSSSTFRLEFHAVWGQEGDIALKDGLGRGRSVQFGSKIDF